MSADSMSLNAQLVGVPGRPGQGPSRPQDRLACSAGEE